MSAAPDPGIDALYEQAACGLLLADRDGRVLRANATLARWLGVEPAALRERTFTELLTVGGRIFWQTHLSPLLRMQGSVSEVKLDLRRADGSTIPVMVNIAGDAGGGRLHIAVFVAEERHKYERELLLQRKRAEDLAAQVARDQEELSSARAEAESRALFAEQLVGMVSHDIRNPLSVIQMSALLLERGVAPEQHKAATARVARSVQRVQHLIGDLLDFTQARLGGGLGVRKASVDLHRAIADGVAELAVAFPGTDLRHEPSGPGQCTADADRLTQAMGNLVANAVNHGSAALPVTVRTEGDGEWFRLSVHNGGAPIPPHLLPRLFEPMVRGAAAGASSGVGLGLFIVREIARAHDGTVHVRSSLEEGTTFELELPRG